MLSARFPPERLLVPTHADGPGLLEITCRPGARGDLGRPTSTPVQNKQGFMEFLEA